MQNKGDFGALNTVKSSDRDNKQAQPRHLQISDSGSAGGLMANSNCTKNIQSLNELLQIEVPFIIVPYSL